MGTPLGPKYISIYVYIYICHLPAWTLLAFYSNTRPDAPDAGPSDRMELKHIIADAHDAVPLAVSR